MGFFDPAGKDEVAAAITAVRCGHASKRQEEVAKAAAKQAGSTGNQARAAFQQKK